MKGDEVTRLREEFERLEADVHVKHQALQKANDNAFKAKAEWESAVKRRKERAKQKRQRKKEREERAEQKRQRKKERKEKRKEERDAMNYPEFKRKLKRRISKKAGKKADRLLLKADRLLKQPKLQPSMNMEALMVKLRALGDKHPVLRVATLLAEGGKHGEIYPAELGGDAEPLYVTFLDDNLVDILGWKTYFEALFGWVTVLGLNPAKWVVTEVTKMSNATKNPWPNPSTEQKRAIMAVCNAIIKALQRVWKETNSEEPKLKASRFLNEVVRVKGGGEGRLANDVVLWPVWPNNFPKAPVLSVAEQLAALAACKEANP